MSKKENSNDVENKECEKEKDKKSKEIEDLKNELGKTKELFLRTAAEYDNYRKRSEKEKDSIYSNAVANTVNAILPIADSLEAAWNIAKNEEGEHKKGLELLKGQMETSLKSLNVESFGEKDEEFDPNIHNAISHIDDEESEKKNFISLVFQKGYKMGDRIIRHAMVQVTN